jgi:hypothetical protein
LPWYRAYQSGCYTHDNGVHGYLSDGSDSARDFLRGGGGQRRQEVPVDVKPEPAQERAVAAIHQVRRLKRGAVEHEASEQKKKVRRALHWACGHCELAH